VANDRLTWVWVPGPDATQPQIDAGNNVVATIDPVVKNVIPFADFLSRWTDAEYLGLLRGRAAGISAGVLALIKQWDIVQAQGRIDLNQAPAQSFKAILVSSGILTQVRADEIFN
jgi:hypothetical protein